MKSLKDEILTAVVFGICVCFASLAMLGSILAYERFQGIDHNGCKNGKMISQLKAVKS